MDIFSPVSESSSRARICLLLSSPLYPSTLHAEILVRWMNPMGSFYSLFLFLTQDFFFFKADTWHYTFLSNYFYFFTFIPNFIIWVFLPLISSFLCDFSFLADSSFAAGESMMSNHWSGNAFQNIQSQLIKCF